MSLKKRFESISGVKRVEELDNGVLKVEWFGKPSDYKSDLREIREESSGFETIEAPSGMPEQTSDNMPIQYIKPN